MKKGEKSMCEKRNQLILQAILDKLGSGTGIYTSEDILTAANIEEQDLNEMLEQLQNDISKMTRKGKKR